MLPDDQGQAVVIWLQALQKEMALIMMLSRPQGQAQRCRPFAHHSSLSVNHKHI